MDLASELEKNSSGITEKDGNVGFFQRHPLSLDFLGPNCNENDVHNLAFKIRMVSDSIEDSVEKMGRCLGI